MKMVNNAKQFKQGTQKEQFTSGFLFFSCKIKETPDGFAERKAVRRKSRIDPDILTGEQTDIAAAAVGVHQECQRVKDNALVDTVAGDSPVERALVDKEDISLSGVYAFAVYIKVKASF